MKQAVYCVDSTLEHTLEGAGRAPLFPAVCRSCIFAAPAVTVNDAMSSTAATPVTAEAEQPPRKGPRKGVAKPVVATSDRLHNRERQSLAQVTEMAFKFNLASPGTVHAVKHVATAQKSTTFIIFDRGRRQQVEAAGEDGEDEDEDEDEDVAPAAAEPKPKPKGKLKPSAKPPQPASRPSPPAPAGRRRPTHACGDAFGEAAGSGSGHTAEEAGSQRAQRVRRLSARYRRLAGARPRARSARVELAVQRREGDSRRGYTGRGHIAWSRARQPRQLQQL